MDLWTLCKLFRVTVSLLKTLKPEKAGMRTFFCYLVAKPVPASQDKQKKTKKIAFSMFKELKGLSVHKTSRRPCVYSRPVRQIVQCPCVLQALLLIIKIKSQLSKRMRTDCTILILKLSNHQNIPFQVFYPTP